MVSRSRPTSRRRPPSEVRCVRPATSTSSGTSSASGDQRAVHPGRGPVHDDPPAVHQPHGRGPERDGLGCGRPRRTPRAAPAGPVPRSRSRSSADRSIPTGAGHCRGERLVERQQASAAGAAGGRRPSAQGDPDRVERRTALHRHPRTYAERESGPTRERQPAPGDTCRWGPGRPEPNACRSGGAISGTSSSTGSDAIGSDLEHVADHGQPDQLRPDQLHPDRRGLDAHRPGHRVEHDPVDQRVEPPPGAGVADTAAHEGQRAATGARVLADQQEATQQPLGEVRRATPGLGGRRGSHGTQRAKELLRLGVGAAVEQQRSLGARGVLAAVAERQLLAPGRPRCSGRRPRGPGRWCSRRSRGRRRSAALRSRPGFQPTPSNFSVPLVAIPLEMCCWSAERKLTQKNPAWRISGHAREVLAGQNITSGGSSETLENDWQVMPDRARRPTSRSPR